MGTTFAQLQQMVYTETNRPDAIAQTTNAILAATQFCHSLEYFFKDIEEATVVLATPDYIQQLQTSAFTRFRKMHLIRKWDPSYLNSQSNPQQLPPLTYGQNYGYSINDNIALKFLTLIDADDIFDEFNREKPDVWYQIGSTINIKSSTQVPQLIAQWYAYPNLGTAADPGSAYSTYSSWIADEFQFAVAYKAASNCFSQFGDIDTAKRYYNFQVAGDGTTIHQGMAAEHIYNLIRNNITARGW